MSLKKFHKYLKITIYTLSFISIGIAVWRAVQEEEDSCQTA